MIKKLSLLAFAVSMLMAIPVHAGESDAQIKSALPGYWKSPRHPYHFQANGLIRMCPEIGPYPATTTNTWDVRKGIFYQNGGPHKILAINERQFVYQEMDEPYAGTVYILYRISRQEANQQLCFGRPGGSRALFSAQQVSFEELDSN